MTITGQGAKDDLIGQLVGASYTITSWIGAGGMGAVYVAKSAKLGDKPVAVKVLAPELKKHPAAVARFQAEAYAAGMIDDAHIVRITDAGELPNGQHYILLEYCDGGSLQGMLERRTQLPFDLVITSMSPVAAALARAHDANLVHRDIKPPNILFVRDGGVLRAKLADFGLVKLLDRVAFVTTAPQTMMGSAGYMPPEQIQARVQVDARTDIYAFGCVLYEMVTGRLPFQGTALDMIRQAATNAPFPAPSTLRPDLPPEWNDVIHGCLAYRREDRIQSINEVIHRLARAIPNGESLMGFFAPRLMANAPRAPTAATFSDAIGPAATLWSEAHASASMSQHRARPRVGRAAAVFLAGAAVGGLGVGAVLAQRASSAPQVATSASPSTSSPMHASPSISSVVPPSPAPASGTPAATPTTGTTLSSSSATPSPAPIAREPRPTAAKVVESRVVNAPANRPVVVPSVPRPTAPAQATPKSPSSPTRTPSPAAESAGQVLLRIKVKPFAEVTVDGKRLGTTPRELLVQPGKHHLVLVGAVDGVDKREEIDVNVTKDMTVSRVW